MTTRRAIGIGFGTTQCRVAVWSHDRVEVIPNDQGNLSTPSYVAFTDTECLVGDAAKTQVVLNPHNTIFNVKRLLGRAFSDPEVQSDIKLFPFSVIERNSKPCIRVQYRGEAKEFSPEEILSMILAHLKETAEAYLSGTVVSAVITVPVYFDFAQRQVVEVAATAAGLRVLRLISESSCSATTYGVSMVEPAHEAQVLVLDVGGGSTNTALFTVEAGVIEIRASAGVPHLGGDDFDSRLVSHLAQRFQREHGRDISGNARALRRLRTACEGAKRTLSVAAKTTIAIDSLCAGVDFYTTVTRAQFEEICQDLFRAVLEPIEVLRDAHVDKTHVDKVVLVGGSTRIPAMVKLVSDFFDGKQPTTVWPIDRDTTVAHGAALQAAVISGNASSSPQPREFLLLDAISRSLGVETAGGVMTPLGDRARTEDNTLLARFVLAGIPRAPRGVPRIEVRFGLDVDQELTVTATDTATRRSSRIVVRGEKRGLTDSEMVDMVVDANVAAARAAARARFVEYVRGLRGVLGESHAAMRRVDTWLEKNPDASIRDYNMYRWKILEAVALRGGPESGGDGVDIPEADVVDEEVLRKWTVVVADPDDVPPAASGMGPEDDQMDMDD